MSLKARRELTTATTGRYARATAIEKERILDEYCAATGYVRKYAIKLLNHPPAARKTPIRHPRARIYDDKIKRALIVVWTALNGICSKRLVAFLPVIVPRLEADGDLQIDAKTRELLLAIKPSTVDTLLKSERKNFGKRGLSVTKPGTLLKKQIAVRTGVDWEDAENTPGFFEIDLVAHCDDDEGGEFLYSLVMTDIFTGWTDFLPLRNKSHKSVLDAIQKIHRRLPFTFRGLDSDNGSEFINKPLSDYCKTNHITFTRGRVGRKNDQAHVEQKNYVVVRKWVSYFRYEGEEVYKKIGALYFHLRLYVNYFQPSMKLLEKHREGSRVKKKYSQAQTPYQRVMASEHVDEETKKRLEAEFQSFNPIDLLCRIEQEKEAIFKLAKPGK